MFRGGETTWLILVHDFLSNAAMDIDVLGLTSFQNVPCAYAYIYICTFDYFPYIYILTFIFIDAITYISYHYIHVILASSVI